MGRRRTLLPVGVALILVGVVGLGVVFLPGGASSVMDGGMDEMFIEQMIPHHDDAIATAELALERSERPEIRRLAEDIRRSQTAENAQMRDWYRAWCGGAPDSGGGMGMGLMGETTDVRALESAPDFDMESLEQMIPHHKMAVMMTSMVGNGGGRPELRELADSMRRAQSREIELMEDWYGEWDGQ